jgi:ABC-2 type transport system ATP-binding protein
MMSDTLTIPPTAHAPVPAASGTPERAGTMSGSAISTSGLTKIYSGRRAVNNVTLTIPAGIVAGFVGPNGAGKTTTIRMLLGMVRPSAGSATVLGEPLSHPSRYMHRVGAMIEGPAFYPTLTGRNNLRALATLGGHSARRVDEVLAVSGLTDRADDKVKGYSLGMKQRLGIAAALLPNPDLLILDEPTNGLDPAGILEVRRMMGTLRDEGKTIFVSSHLLTELEQVADWIVLVKEGAVLFSGPIATLMERREGGELLIMTERPDQLAVVAGIAHECGHTATIRDGRLHVTAPEAFAVELNRASMQAGVALAQITPIHASLEETFFSMTEGG